MLRYEIDGRRYLRLLEEVDAAELYAVVDANRRFLTTWMPWAAEQSAAGTVEFIRRTRKQLGENQGLQVAMIDDDHIVGVLGFHRLDWENRSTSIGYWIAEAAQGRGTVTASVRILVDHAFSVWDLNRAEIRAGTENLRSRAIPERLGFAQEGILREAEVVGDRFVDHVVYAMLARDWRSLPIDAPARS